MFKLHNKYYYKKVVIKCMRKLDLHHLNTYLAQRKYCNV